MYARGLSARNVEDAFIVGFDAAATGPSAERER
jgi:hypothetical protein